LAQYTLKFAADTDAGEQTLTFFEEALGGALEIAKKSATGNWAELSEEGKLLYRMELVHDTGVWRVIPHGGD